MTPDELIQIGSRRAVHLEGLKTSQIKKLHAQLNKAIRAASVFIAAGEEVAGMGLREFNKILKDLKSQQIQLNLVGINQHIETLIDLADDSAGFELKALGRFTKQRVLKAVASKSAYLYAKRSPLSASGELLEDFVEDLGGRAAKRVESQVRIGRAQGETNAQIIRRIVGTKARNYKDGVAELSRRDAATVVRTSVQHTANAGYRAVWNANSDIVKGYKWVSTLDGNTSEQCRNLGSDGPGGGGKVFKLGKGPVPPIHLNCRSTTVADLGSEFDFLDEGATRSALGGPVDANLGYYDWLKTQGKAFQDDTLGKTRGKLFREGGLSTTEFSALQLDRQFKPLTLKEMKQKEPLAFQKADL